MGGPLVWPEEAFRFSPVVQERREACHVTVMTKVYSTMALDEVRSAAANLQCDIANGPVSPDVTPQEIREYLTSRYDFTKPTALEDVVADVEQMLRTWQVQVTHPRYFGLPGNAAANFTNGGAESNLSAVVVGLTRAFPDYGEVGLRQLAESPTIY